MILKQQLCNLFATELSPGLMLITQYYTIEINGNEIKYKHDRLEQASWLIENNSNFKNSVIMIRKMRNHLVHRMSITMAMLDECIMCMLISNNAKNAIRKQLIELVLDGLLSVCIYLENPTKDTCPKCPLC